MNSVRSMAWLYLRANKGIEATTIVMLKCMIDKEKGIRVKK